MAFSRSVALLAIIVSIVAIGGLRGCGNPITVKQALEAARLFVDALSLLERSSQYYQAYVAETVENTKKQLSQASAQQVNLPSIATEWEKRWKVVHEQIDVLDERFKAVDEASNNYWEMLDAVTEEIKDSALRGAEQAKNDAARHRWATAYQSAALQLGRAKLLRDRGNDLGRTMLAAALRQNLVEQTETLNAIAREAEMLLQSLELLTQEGKSIVTSMN